MIEKPQVKQAVDALLALIKSKDDDVLFDQAQKVDVQVTFKKVPKCKHKAVHINLPHSIHYDTREVCVFVKDMDKKNRDYEPTVQHYENLFKEKKVEHISKIVPLKALRTDYSMHSNKRSLAKAYDLYLADECVMGLLPGMLGKIFYGKKKTVPVSVNLGLKDLKSEVDRVVNNTRFVIQGTGSTSMVCVGNHKMTKNVIVSNVLAACKQINEKLQGGFSNIRSVHIKSTDTPAIPICINLESPNAIELPKVKRQQMEVITDEITTVEEGKVMIRADGLIKVVGGLKKSETDDMSDDEEDEDDESSSEDEDAPKPTKAKDEKKEVEIVQKSNQKPVKEVNKGPNQAKNGRKRGNEDKAKTGANKKQKQTDIKQKPAAAAAKKQQPGPGSDKKPVSAKQNGSGKKSTKQAKENKTPVTDKKPAGGKKNKKRPTKSA